MEIIKYILENKKRSVFIFLIFCFALFILWFWQGIYMPIGGDTSAVFTIKKGDSILVISENLQKQGLIKNKVFFRTYVLIRGVAPNMQAGSYDISPSMNIPKIAGKFFRGESIKKQIKIIEGWDFNDIIKYLISQNIYIESQISNAVNSAQVQETISSLESFSGRRNNSDFEGYFFPDTYEITLDTSAEEFVQMVFLNFDKKLDSNLRKEIARQKKSVFDIITMASLIEKEVKNYGDKKIVSGILWKRIKMGMPLQVDSTLLYQNELEGNRVLIADTKIDSPYNTYKNKGLPIGPISNPGLESIKAAIYPSETSYLYYLSTPGGKTIFSKTFSEHVAAKARYLK